MIEPIPLARAVYCADCQCITETNGTSSCGYCTSSAIVWLQHLLDGPNVVETNPASCANASASDYEPAPIG